MTMTSSQLIPHSTAFPNVRLRNRAIEENSEQLTTVLHIIAGSSVASVEGTKQVG